MGGREATKVLVELNENSYSQYREKLIGLYLHAFTTGDFAQHIPAAEAGRTLDYLNENGVGTVCLVEDVPVAMLFWHPLAADVDFPKTGLLHIEAEKCAYIAEVVVHSDWRGHGIASWMIESALKQISRNFSSTVIRVWDKNVPAVALYRKMGFREIASIMQTKWHDPHESFEMRKIYMIKITDKNTNLTV